MSATIKALGLDRLGPAERLLLAGELWDSVALDATGPLLGDAHRADLAARLEEYKDDPLAGAAWAEVKARLAGGGS